MAGDCGGLFLLTCCRVISCRLKETSSRSAKVKFIMKRIDRQTTQQFKIPGTSKKEGDEKNGDAVETNSVPSGTYPMIECEELGLSVRGVLLSLYALGKFSCLLCSATEIQ